MKISFFAKLLAIRRYLSEVPVEGKRSNRFLLTLGYYEQFVSQVIRIGNCTTLLSNRFEITVDSFWNTNHFEDYAKYVFWTFNYSFLLKLIEGIPNQKLATLMRCQELLSRNENAFTKGFYDETDEELSMCFIKNETLREIPAFRRMYILDEQNRRMFLREVSRRISEIGETYRSALSQRTTISESPAPPPVVMKSTPFHELLVATDGDSGKTLQLIKTCIEEAGFKEDLFSPVRRLPNGKNPYGFNGSMAAMVDFFYQHNYFRKEHRFEEIFRSYLEYSGNSIGKLTTFFSEFRQDRSYKKHFAKLKALKINKLV